MKAPSFPFYVNNWLASHQVSAMTPAQEGAYVRLLCYAWNSPDCGLPNDDCVLATISRLGPEWAAGSGDVIRRCFFLKNERLFNERLLACWQESQKFRDKQRLSGLASGLARAAKSVNAGSTVVQPSLNPESESDIESDLDTTKIRLLADRLIDSLDRKPVTTAHSTSLWIGKLVKRGVSHEEIADTIDWLAKDNKRSTYAFVVESGKSLYEKWDRIQAVRHKGPAQRSTLK